jgi:predicted alpha/beta hydrolase family esterase
MPTVAIFCHGWNTHGGCLWFRKLVPLLEERSVRCVYPTFPDPEDPRYPQWRDFLLALVEEAAAGGDFLFVAHSMGGYLVLRFLADYATKEWIPRCRGAVLVAAPATKRPEYRPFYDAEIDWAALRAVPARLIAVHSSDDAVVREEHPRLIALRLGDLPTFALKMVGGFGHFITRELPDEIWGPVASLLEDPPSQ